MLNQTKNNKHIYISINLYNKGFIPAGVITFNDEVGFSGFSYFPSYMEKNYPPLNPATLNYRDGNNRHFVVNTQTNHEMLDRTFMEMLPQKNDWGTHVLISRFPEYSNMTGAQKLYFLGNRIVGGLSAYVKEKPEEENINTIEWLDKVREESVSFYMHDLSKISYIKAINPLTSYGGVRPKCMFQDDEGEFWIAKFNLPTDPYNMAKTEQIAMDMAKDMGLNASTSKIIQLPSGEDVFLSKRFDREGTQRFHSLSMFALAPGNEFTKKKQFMPGNPAGFIQTLVRRYSDFSTKDTAELVLKLLLDTGVNNTDNHLRNLRVILNKDSKWELSPVFDVIFNPYSQPHVYNPAGMPLEQLYLENPEFIESMSKELNVSTDLIIKQINKVKPVVNNWESYCIKYDMSEEDSLKIGNAVNLGMRRRELEKKLSIQSPSLNIPKLKPQNK